MIFRMRSYRNKLSEWGFLKTKQDLDKTHLAIQHLPEALLPPRIPLQPFLGEPGLSTICIGLYEAISESNEERVSSVLGTGFPHSQIFHSPPEFSKVPMNEDGESFLNIAAKRENPSLLSIMISAGFNVRFAGKKGYEALHIAAQYDCPENIGMLLKYGAFSEARDFENLQPLHHAISRGSVKATKKLLSYGVHGNDTSFPDQRLVELALQYPEANVRYSLTRMLLESTASLTSDHRPNDLFDQFLRSCRKCLPNWSWSMITSPDQRRCLELFVSAGADPLLLGFTDHPCSYCGPAVSLLHEAYTHVEDPGIFEAMLSGILQAQNYQKWITYIAHLFRGCPIGRGPAMPTVDAIRRFITQSRLFTAEVRLSFSSLLFNLLLQSHRSNELVHCLESLFDLGFDLFHTPVPTLFECEKELIRGPFETIMSTHLDTESTFRIIRICSRSGSSSMGGNALWAGLS